MGLTIGERWREKPTRRSLKAAASRQSGSRVKGAAGRAVADSKAARGALPQWTTDDIEEAFRRFHAAEPEPEGELEHVNPVTLLVAVVLSAQATDAGVNKATPALFAAADTPQKMVALGEERVRDYDQDDRPLPHQGEERHRAVAEAGR